MQPQHPSPNLKLLNSTSSLSAQPPSALPTKAQLQPPLLSWAHSREELQKPWDHDIPRERPQKTGLGGFGRHGQRLNLNYFGRGMCKGISLAAGAVAGPGRDGGAHVAQQDRSSGTRGQHCPVQQPMDNGDPGGHCHALLKLNQSLINLINRVQSNKEGPKVPVSLLCYLGQKGGIGEPWIKGFGIRELWGASIKYPKILTLRQL